MPAKKPDAANDGRPAQFRSCVFDLETSSLEADFGVILCGVVLPDGGEPKVFRADTLNKKWSKCRSDDSAVVLAIAEELKQYQVLVGHNAKWFDLPFIRSRLMRWGLPPFPEPRLIDPLLIARNHLRHKFNGLDSLAKFLGVKDQKTDVLGDTWMRASLDGDRKAMDEIVEHCRLDVLILERVFVKLRAYMGQINPRGSAW